MNKIFSLVKEHPRDTLIALILISLALMMLAIFAPQALLVAVGLGALAWASYSPPTPTPEDHGYEQAVVMVYNILRNSAEALGAICPETPEVLAPFWPPIVPKGGIEVISLRIEKRGQSALTPLQFRDRLESRIGIALDTGEVPGVHPYAWNGKGPVFAIVNVADFGATIDFDLAYLNTKEQCDGYERIAAAQQAVARQRLNRPKAPPTDDEF